MGSADAKVVREVRELSVLVRVVETKLAETRSNREKVFALVQKVRRLVIPLDQLDLMMHQAGWGDRIELPLLRAALMDTKDALENSLLAIEMHAQQQWLIKLFTKGSTSAKFNKLEHDLKLALDRLLEFCGSVASNAAAVQTRPISVRLTHTEDHRPRAVVRSVHAA